MGNKPKRLLIAGICPPPIGGVSVHVQRLFFLSRIAFPEIEIRLFQKFPDIGLLFNCHLVHVHFGHPVKRFFLVSLCKLFRCKVIVTLHGDYSRTKGLALLLTMATARLSDQWITLNESTFNFFSQKVSNVSLESSFLKPIKGELASLSLTDREFLSKAKALFQLIVSVPTYRLDFFEGREIYGVFDVLQQACQLKDILFVVSDPSGTYRNQALSSALKVPNNVRLISYSHSLIEVLEYCDVLLRNTSTDGDSVSVKEALFLGKIVLATKVVSRPEGVILYSGSDWVEILIQLKRAKSPMNNEPVAEFRYQEIYSQFLY